MITPGSVGLWLRLEFYLAVTTNTVQLGGKIEVGIKASVLNAVGWLALDALIEKTVVQAAAAARYEPADRVLFLGNRHHAFPTAVIKDPVLEPVDKLVWMAIMLGVQETGGNTAFPGYGAIGRIANVASRSTIARAIAIR